MNTEIWDQAFLFDGVRLQGWPAKYCRMSPSVLGIEVSIDQLKRGNGSTNNQKSVWEMLWHRWARHTGTHVTGRRRGRSSQSPAFSLPTPLSDVLFIMNSIHRIIYEFSFSSLKLAFVSNRDLTLFFNIFEDLCKALSVWSTVQPRRPYHFHSPNPSAEADILSSGAGFGGNWTLEKHCVWCKERLFSYVLPLPPSLKEYVVQRLFLPIS